MEGSLLREILIVLDATDCFPQGILHDNNGSSLIQFRLVGLALNLPVYEYLDPNHWVKNIVKGFTKWTQKKEGENFRLILEKNKKKTYFPKKLNSWTHYSIEENRRNSKGFIAFLMNALDHWRENILNVIHQLVRTNNMVPNRIIFKSYLSLI